MSYFANYTEDYSTKKESNINTAKSILKNLGVEDFALVNYSDSFGVSVYFKSDLFDKTIRISDHGVKSFDRVENEICLSFDKKTIGINGEGVQDKQKTNKLMLEIELK